jgi:putative ABC transport system permease protein
MLFILAWKNIWRNKKRSMIVILAITFGLWGGLFSGSVMMGMGESIVETSIKRNLAHIQLHHRDFKTEKDITLVIPDVQHIIASLQQLPQVTAACGRLIIEGMAASATSNFGVQITGIDPQAETEVTDIHRKLIYGSYFVAGKKNQVIIGEKLAERLNLRFRSKLVLSFQGLEGEIINYACKVNGIFKTESAQFDQFYLYVPQKDLYRLLSTPPLVHEIAVRLNSASLTEKTKEIIQAQYPSLLVQSWTEIAPELAFLSFTMQSFTYLFVAIILCALLFGITNTMLMSVIDRVREFGVLIAVGMKKSKIFFMILLETVFLSLTGGAGGITIGGLTILYFSKTGIDLSFVAASLESFGASTMLYPYLPYIMYIILTLMIILAANFAAIFPALKAMKLQPAQAIRTI